MNLSYNRNHPYPAKIVQRSLATKQASSKQVFHVVLDISEANFSYKVGDSIGIYPSNDPIFVEKILACLPCNSQMTFFHTRSQKMLTVEDFLTNYANLSRITAALLKPFAAHPDINHTMLDKDKLSAFIACHDVIDLMCQYGSYVTDIESVMNALSPLLPRLYSIASSPTLSPHQVHLVLALTSFHHAGQLRYGVASHFLAQRAPLHINSVRCFIQQTPHFTLPPDPSAPIIMVGPGTGIAPFIGFIQERMFYNAPGENWLFFGERNRKTDFTREEYFLSLVAQNKLLIDLAFSRDQEQKVYVQHKIIEKGAEIWNWLEKGAYFYVCGAADPMGKDVENALLSILSLYGNLEPDAAKVYIKQLRHDKRYLVDVY